MRIKCKLRGQSIGVSETREMQFYQFMSLVMHFDREHDNVMMKRVDDLYRRMASDFFDRTANLFEFEREIE